MALLDDLDRRREMELRDRENSARLAQSYATFITTGVGSMQHEDRISFGTTFIERPFVSHAAVIDTEQVRDQMQRNEEQDEFPLPLVTGYVTEWDEDERGFYIGCWLAVRVFYSLEDLTVESEELPVYLDPKIEVEHHFTFAAIAMKDIPNASPSDFEDDV